MQAQLLGACCRSCQQNIACHLAASDCCELLPLLIDSRRQTLLGAARQATHSAASSSHEALSVKELRTKMHDSIADLLLSDDDEDHAVGGQ